MEYVFPDLLSREEILRILQERKISGISDLPDTQLLRIYKTFALPFAQRMGKQKQRPLKRFSTDSEMDVDEPLRSTKQMKHFHIDEVNAKIFCLSDKRRVDSDDDSLTSATKRIKIDWP